MEPTKFNYKSSSPKSIIIILLFLCNYMYSQTWWTQTVLLTERKSFLGTASVNGAIYAIGGMNVENTTAFSSTIEVYFTTKLPEAWYPRYTLPDLSKRAGIGVGAVNGIIYIAGGSGTPASPTKLEAYDPFYNTLSINLRPLNYGRWDLAACAVNGMFYAIGGCSNISLDAVSYIEMYDPINNIWSRVIPDMPTPRYGLSACVLNGIIYTAGGRNAAGNYYSTFEAFNPVTKIWTIKTPMPQALAYLGLCAVNGVVYAVGGQNSAGNPQKTVYAYYPAQDRWAALPSLETARYGLGLCEVNGTLYAVGGAEQNNLSLGTVEVCQAYLTRTEKSINSIPTEYALYQNYPNPFNPSTTIKFSIPRSDFVALKIFDALGKEVSSVLSKQMAAGTHTVKWNGSGLAGGIYFYRLTTGDFSQTKKLLLLK